MGGKSQPQQTVTADSGPWAPQQPYLSYGFSEARRLYDQGGPQLWSGPLVADASDISRRAEAAVAARAAAGSPLVTQAQRQLGSVIGGDYLSAGNPYFSGMISQLNRSLAPQIDSSFARAGRYGSASHARAYSDALSGVASNLAYQNYAAERANQQAAAVQSPALANQDYVDLGQLAQVGQNQDARAQALLAAQMQSYQAAQNRPYQALANYLSMIGGNYGQSSTQTTTRSGGPSPLTEPLGKLGATIGSVYGGPIGGAFGNVAGQALGGLIK